MLIQDLTPTELKVCVMLYGRSRSIIYNQELGYLLLLTPEEKGGYEGNAYYQIAPGVMNSLIGRGLLISHASPEGKVYFVLDTANAKNASFINELAVQIALGSI